MTQDPTTSNTRPTTNDWTDATRSVSQQAAETALLSYAQRELQRELTLRQVQGRTAKMIMAITAPVILKGVKGPQLQLEVEGRQQAFLEETKGLVTKALNLPAETLSRRYGALKRTERDQRLRETGVMAQALRNAGL